MEFINDWDERYQTATEKLNKSQTIVGYQKLKKIQLERTADLEVWKPSRYVLEANPYIEQVEVELITPNTDLNQVNAVWVSEKRLGLVVLGPVIHRKSKPYLIIVTTKKKYYAIDPDDKRAIRFLTIKLMSKQKFYTSNGLHESDCLYHNFNIDLCRGNNTCCTGLDISLMESMKNKPASALSMYPQYAVANSKRSTVINKFEKLVEVWLDIFKEDIAFQADQFEHLLERDKYNKFNLTATNIIKKRCGLVVALADKLEYYNWLEVSIMMKKSFNCLLRGTPRIQKQIYLNLKEGNCVDIFFAHYHGLCD